MPSQVATLALLSKLGFMHYECDRAFSDIDELVAEIDRFNAIRTSRTMPYDCDGVVVKVHERRHQEFLGLNTTFPNWCKARKFPQEAQSTLVRGVVFQVGMTGHVTPVAELEPTTIGGAVVSRATLNNEAYIRNLGLSVGSYVFVQRAGEVIPQVTGPDTERNALEDVTPSPIVFPSNCPSCGAGLTRKGEYVVCPNHHCREQVVQRLEYWCGKDCANITGLGRSMIEDLVDKLGISSVDALYRHFAEPGIDDFADIARRDADLAALGGGYGEKTVGTIFDGVRGSIASLTLDRIIGGLGIDGVGKLTGRQLAAHFKSLDALRSATVQDLLAVDNIGEVTASAIAAFFGTVSSARDDGDMPLFAAADDGVADAQECHVGEYACLFDPAFGFNTAYAAAERLGAELDGLSVIFTGTSSRFKREEIKEFLERHGAKYVSSVSAKTSFVVTGDAPGANKIQKAEALGVPVLAEREFYAKFGL